MDKLFHTTLYWACDYLSLLVKGAPKSRIIVGMYWYYMHLLTRSTGLKIICPSLSLKQNVIYDYQKKQQRIIVNGSFLWNLMFSFRIIYLKISSSCHYLVGPARGDLHGKLNFLWILARLITSYEVIEFNRWADTEPWWQALGGIYGWNLSLVWMNDNTLLKYLKLFKPNKLSFVDMYLVVNFRSLWYSKYCFFTRYSLISWGTWSNQGSFWIWARPMKVGVTQ